MTSKIDDVYVFPTTYPQKQIWFLYQLDQESPAYNIPFAYDIEGDLNIDAMHKAINEIIERHETFRTHFIDTNDGLVQFVQPEMQIELPVMSEFSSENEIKNFIDTESVRPFDLTKGPLIRASIIKRAETSYILFLNFHHIILDHISIVQFAEELTILYKAFSNNEASPLIKPELQYADYSVWQNQHQTHEQLLPKRDFWLEQLEGKTDYLDIPLDNKRPVMQSMVGKEYHLWFPLSLLNSLKALSRQESVSMYITLMAGYSILLGIYSKQTDVSVGTPFANRGHQPELEKIMGCFINTIPIHTDLSGNPSFNEVLKRVRKMVFGANANQEFPFEMIVEALKPKRDTSYNPLFQVGFTFQEAPMEINLEACAVKSQRLHNQSAKFDMLAWLWESSDGIRGLLEYNSDILEYSTLDRFAEHFQTLLENAVIDPDASISDLNILSDAEFKKVTKEWNQTSITFNSPQSIHQLFELQCDSNADKTAIICDEEKLTYKELNDRANQLANYLISIDVKDNALVGVCLERSLDMIVATLGILKAGACYIPLDPEYPQDRIQYMLENSDASLVVTQSSVLNFLKLPEITKPIQMDVDFEAINSQSTSNPDINVSENDLAYIIYTSGSTGKPKGVMVHHGAAANFISSMAESPGLSSDDTLLAITTLSFDIAVLELYLPLSQGATVVIATADEATDGEDLIELMEENKVSIMQATPATWRLLLSSDWDGCSSLKVLCGGEAMPRDLLTDLLPKVGEIWNMYGPTETTVWSTCYKLTDAEAPIFIGKPIANTTLYVLDSNLKPVPVGIHGELYIGGTGVTTGYLNRDDLTEERYIDNPFSSTNEKLYRTGDLVKFHETGDLEYYQRIDNQVKVRGFRIELGEIESVLSKQDMIDQAVVVVREARPGDLRLVAYVVAAKNVTVTTTSIRKAIGQDLPDYMLPQHIVELNELPLTPNGKIDKKALPDAFLDTDSKEQIIPPKNNAEQLLVNIWAEVLDTDGISISIRDNFFDIGGHSLLSMQVLMKIRNIFGVKIHPREMILNNLEQLAEQCGLAETSIDEVEFDVNVNNNQNDDKSTGIASIFKKMFKKN